MEVDHLQPPELLARPPLVEVLLLVVHLLEVVLFPLQAHLVVVDPFHLELLRVVEVVVQPSIIVSPLLTFLGISDTSITILSSSNNK